MTRKGGNPSVCSFCGGNGRFRYKWVADYRGNVGSFFGGLFCGIGCWQKYRLLKRLLPRNAWP
ncbi:MAG TPA: hypothetical protein PK472_11695 [Pseudomonadota bacterium]|nr:hypothetical protein [Pseudomonadota bacterium]